MFLFGYGKLNLLLIFGARLSTFSTMVLSSVGDYVQHNNYSLVITEYR